MSEVLGCGGDCGSCARCKDRERHEEAAWYAKQDEEQRMREAEDLHYAHLQEEGANEDPR